jgi:hypothetical protein
MSENQKHSQSECEQMKSYEFFLYRKNGSKICSKGIHR